MKNRGFTLIELIVVIAIIAVLAAIVAPNAFRAIEKAKLNAMVTDYKNMKAAAAQFYGDTNAYPRTCAAAACVAAGATPDFFVDPGAAIAPNWDGPYLEKWPIGRWGAGVVNWRNANGVMFCTGAGCVAALERNIRITLVPQTVAVRIDNAIDGAVNNAAGIVRYTAAANTNVDILVTREGPVLP